MLYKASDLDNNTEVNEIIVIMIMNDKPNFRDNYNNCITLVAEPIGIIWLILKLTTAHDPESVPIPYKIHNLCL
jgi:hypothetical protein